METAVFQQLRSEGLLVVVPAEPRYAWRPGDFDGDLGGGGQFVPLKALSPGLSPVLSVGWCQRNVGGKIPLSRWGGELDGQLSLAANSAYGTLELDGNQHRVPYLERTGCWGSVEWRLQQEAADPHALAVW